MKTKHQEQVLKEIVDVVNPILDNWENYTENELEYLLKKLGNICRDETSLVRKEVLPTKKIAETLLKIGNEYDNNHKILTQIVSSIHNMNDRYSLEISDDWFKFFIHQTKNRKVNFYVSVFITDLPQFASYEDKWKYIMSIPNIAPKDKSMHTFYQVINDNINIIPNELKTEIIKIFEKYITEKKLHETTIENYQEIIEKLK